MVGLATGLAIVVLLRDADGAHENTPPALALAFKVMLPPLQIVASAPAAAKGKGLTVTMTVSVAVPQNPVAISINAVVTVGLATGKGQLLQLNPIKGIHKKVPFPLPLKVVISPEQIV